MTSTSYVVEADGGSRGNPGPAGYGAVVKDATGAVLAEVAESIGTATNNVAEYRGLIAGLSALLDLAGDGAQVQVRMDSKLVVEQMRGRWKIKNEGLRPLAAEAAALGRRLRVTWKWIPRAENSHADRLANEAMDAAAKGRTWRADTRTTTAATPPARGTSTASSATTVTTATTATTTTTASTGTASSATRAGGAARHTAPTLFDDLDADAAEPTGTPGTDTTGSTTATDVTGTTAAADRAGARPGGAPAVTPTGWMAPTKTATTLLLLRHGETPLSVDRRFSGGTGDPELTAKGRAQAEAAALRLSRPPYRLDAIVSSPLVRARQTADAVAAATGLPVAVDEDLRENDFGAWEGYTFAEIQERWPDRLQEWLADPSVAPPGGESFERTARRVQAAADRVLAAHEGATVLVVSHVTPIKLLLRFALAAPPEALYRMHLDVAALCAVDYYADGPAVVKSLNDTAHLR